MNPPESIHALKGREVAVVAGGETLRGRLADAQGECLILTSESCGETTTAVVRWPLVAAVVVAKEPFLRCCTCKGTCKGAEGLAPGWVCALANQPEAKAEPR